MAGALWSCNNSNRGHDAADSHFHSIVYTAYNPFYEVFIETEPLMAGEDGTLTLHLTRLSDFKAADSLTVTAALGVGAARSAEQVRTGIYKVQLTPDSSGPASLNITVGEGEEASVVAVPLEVYADHAAVHRAAEAAVDHPANSVTFTKETSWNCDFATDSVAHGPFATVIEAVALVESSGTDLRTVSSRTAGTVVMRSNDIVPGKVVSAGEHILTVDASGQADNNLSVTMSQARVEYQAAERDYERKRLLAQEQIVSQTDLMEARRRFEEAEARYRQLERSFPGGAQNVVAPAAGSIAQVFVANGQYVEAGAPLFSLSQGRDLTLTAKVPAADRAALARIDGATVRIPSTGRTYTLDQLGGRLIGYGRTVAGGSSLIPVTFEVCAVPELVPGTFVDIYINVGNSTGEISVPRRAVVEEMGNCFVFVQVTPEIFEKRAVTLGRTDGRRCVVESGLSGRERIVTRGAVLVKLSQASGTLDAHAGHVH